MKKILTLVVVVVLAALTIYISISPQFKKVTEKNVPVFTELQDGVSMDTDVVYEDTEKGQCNLDVAWQKNGEKKPLLVLVHGGSWISGKKESLAKYLYTYSAQGYVVANINYELIDLADVDTPKLQTVTGQIDNINTAMEWLVNHADQYEIDTTRIYIAGHSAGGQLVGKLTEDQSLHPENYGYSIKGLFMLSAATDLRYFLYSDVIFAELGVSSVELAFMYDGKYDSDVITEINKVDVRSNIHSNMPPTLLVHGDFDSVLPYYISEETYNKMQEKGVPSKLVIIHEMEHNIELQPVCNAISEFLKEQGEV